MGGDGFAGSVEPRGAAVWWNRAGSRLRSFALVRQLAPLDRQIPHRLVIDTPKASSLIGRSEEHTYELQSLMRNPYAVFFLKNKNKEKHTKATNYQIDRR